MFPIAGRAAACRALRAQGLSGIIVVRARRLERQFRRAMSGGCWMPARTTALRRHSAIARSWRASAQFCGARYGAKAQYRRVMRRAGDIELDLKRRLVRRDGDEIHLSPREFDLLCRLMANSGHRTDPHQTGTFRMG